MCNLYQTDFLNFHRGQQLPIIRILKDQLIKSICEIFKDFLTIHFLTTVNIHFSSSTVKFLNIKEFSNFWEQLSFGIK